MKKKTILVCDDEASVAKRWTAELGSAIPSTFEATPIQREEFALALKGLKKRREDCRAGKTIELKGNRFDQVAIVVVNYELSTLFEEVDLTGEEVAYLCRCYSSCGLIVGLNQYGPNSFDLTLKGHPESYADLNIGSEQLANKGLWKAVWTGRTSFRPWSWPILPQAYNSFERRVASIQSRPRSKVLDWLFPDAAEVVASLPRTALEFLGSGKDPSQTTFESFVWESDNGLNSKDQRKVRALHPAQTARIAGARLAKWLERLVLSGQDVLVDAPHLAQRYPSLLRGSPKALSAWNRTVSFSLPEIQLEGGKIDRYRFKADHWLSRPAWLWKRLGSKEDLPEIKRPWTRTPSGFVFCEDVSRFLPREDAQEFVADLPSTFVRRFAVGAGIRGEVAGLGNVKYTPAVRFSR